MARKKDKLEGYRGVRPDQLRAAAAKNMEEGEPIPETSPYKRFLLGVQAEKLRAGVATLDDVGAVMGEIINRMESQCQMHMKALLANPDLTSVEAQVSHFDARVCAALITELNNLVAAGIEAGRQLQEGDTEV